MQLSKEYGPIFIKAEDIQQILTAFEAISVDSKIKTLTVGRANEEWQHDSFHEFLADVRPDSKKVIMSVSGKNTRLAMFCYPQGDLCTSVQVVSSSRSDVLKIFNTVDAIAARSKLPVPPPEPKPVPVPFKIFVGHGGSQLWRDLKDHLHEHHRYEVIAYETGSRAGHGIRDVIQEMLDASSFAILVMTGEDAQPDGTFRARQNVVHEIGLFQGRLGFHRAIVLLEKGTEEFSNIHGVHQIRFSKGNIKETFGEVLATLKREEATRS